MELQHWSKEAYCPKCGRLSTIERDYTYVHNSNHRGAIQVKFKGLHRWFCWNVRCNRPCSRWTEYSLQLLPHFDALAQRINRVWASEHPESFHWMLARGKRVELPPIPGQEIAFSDLISQLESSWRRQILLEVQRHGVNWLRRMAS